MVRIIFADSEDEADHKAGMLRDPADVEELQDYLAHKKSWLDTCDVCLRWREADLAMGLPAQPSEPSYNHEPNDFKRAPIATLLPELLVHIFLFLMRDDPARIRETWDASYTRIIEAPYLGWIQVTHVCRRWRNVAISGAILWEDLCQGAVLGPSWTQIFMYRVKSAAVTIRHFGDFTESLIMICNYLLDHVAHLRHVTLSTDWSPWDLLVEYASTWSSALVSVSLDGGIGHYHCPALFGGYAPNLKRLQLSNIHPWRSHSLFGGLVELDVFLCSSIPPDIASGDPDPIVIGILPSISQALDVLDEAPMLQRLALHYAFPSDDLPVIDRRRAYLNHVQELCLSAKIVDCVSFFTRVFIPFNATLNLTCIPGLHSEKFQDLFGMLADRLAPLGSEPSIVSRLEIGTGKIGDNCLFRIFTDSHGAVVQKARTSSRNIAPPRRDSSSKPFITLSLAYATSLQHAYVLRTFFSTMPLHDLTHLAIFGCWHVDPDGWRTIFRDSHTFLQSVRFLVLGQDCAQYFFHAIHDEETSTAELLHPLPFPNLDALILRNIDFATFSCALDKVSFQEQIMYDLHGRERRGRKLRVLYFISCQGLYESWIADLREVVRFVVFGF